MKKKTKWILIVCALVFAAFMGNMWYQDYQNTHEAIEVETPEGISDEVKG